MSDGPASVRDTGRPFPGLRPFGYEDRDVYFGRSAQIFALYRLLDRSRFVAAVGSSGSGKSSLAFAGLRPLLEKETRQAGGRHWVWRQMSPKNAPIDGLIELVYGLACELQAGAESDPAFLASLRGRIAYLIRLSSHGLVDALAEIEGLRDKTLVLLVDQFEELFRYARSSRPQARPAETLQREEAVLFVQLLLAASRDQESRAHIILTMRSDFIGDCAAFRGLPEAVSETQFLVPALTRDQLEEVIRKPIEKYGATIESRLVERLLNDVSDESDQLPVLQHCLLRLWEAAGKSESGAGTPPTAAAETAPRAITAAHYNAIGRIAGALSQHADEILSGLAGLEPVVERVFRALSVVDKDGRATRREITFSRLAAETGDAEADLRKVLDRFRADDCSFLRPMLSEKPTLEPDTPLDVGHEALLRRWERVRGDPEATGQLNDRRPIGWLREEEEDGRHYQALLYQDELPLSQVKRTLAWWTARPHTPAWAERYGGRYERVQQLLERGQAALKRQIRMMWAFRGALAFVTVLLIVAVTLAGMFYSRQLAAQRGFDTAYKLTNSILRSVQDGFNRGDISTPAAMAMADLLVNSVKQPAGVQQNADVNAQVLLTVTDIYYTVGDLQQAYAQATAANGLAKQLVAAVGDDAAWLLLYGSLFRIADVEVAGTDRTSIERGLTDYKSAQAIAQRLKDKSPGDPARLYDLAFIDNKVAETLDQLGQPAEAMIQFNAALAIAQQITTIDTATIDQQAYLPSILTKIGNMAVKTDLATALADYAKAISLQNALLKKAPRNDIILGNLLLSHRANGDALLKDAVAKQGDFQPAFDEYEAAIAVGQGLLNKDAGNALWLTYQASAYHHYGNGLMTANRRNDAIAQYRNEVAVRQRLVDKDPTNADWQRELQNIQKKVADLTALQNQPAPPPAPPAQDVSNHNAPSEAKP